MMQRRSPRRPPTDGVSGRHRKAQFSWTRSRRRRRCCAHQARSRQATQARVGYCSPGSADRMLALPRVSESPATRRRRGATRWPLPGRNRRPTRGNRRCLGGFVVAATGLVGWNARRFWNGPCAVVTRRRSHAATRRAGARVWLERDGHARERRAEPGEIDGVDGSARRQSAMAGARRHANVSSCRARSACSTRR